VSVPVALNLKMCPHWLESYQKRIGQCDCTLRSARGCNFLTEKRLYPLAAPAMFLLALGAGWGAVRCKPDAVGASLTGDEQSRLNRILKN